VSPTEHTDLADKTIADFGEQWTSYRDNTGRYASTEYLFDIVSPLLGPDDIRGSRVADIGSGTGRIVLMLLDAGAAFVHAVEPSQAFDVLRRNTADFSERVSLHNVRGEQLPAGLDLDLVVSIGVIHHIPDPAPTLRAAFAALRAGGRCLVWLYGHEGNERYLAVAGPVRSVTTRLPHPVLAILCHALNGIAGAYAWAARLLPLPLAGYMRNVFARMDRRARYLVIYDQLNPAYAKYYRRDEAIALLADAGFTDVAAHHRHGYSWTVAGRKP
jgi:SAM-dependent methyltransferase